MASRSSRVLPANEPDPAGQSRATIDKVTRKALQNSCESTAALAVKYGINRKTVAKWRKRDGTEDLPRNRPRERNSNVLSIEEEAIIVGFRQSTKLPLDDCYYALKSRLPNLTRSNLYRCFKRHGINRIGTDHSVTPTFPDVKIGRWNIELRRAVTQEGIRFGVVAIDEVSKLFFGGLLRSGSNIAMANFIVKLCKIVPYRIDDFIIHADSWQPADIKQIRVLTIDRLPWKEREYPLPNFISSDAYIDLDIERMRPREDPPLSERELKIYLSDFNFRYNFLERLKTLGGKTPIQFVNDAWKTVPNQFWRRPQNLDFVRFHYGTSDRLPPLPKRF